MEEYLDIVDENNNPTGEKRKRLEVHTLGLWHRVVHIYVFRRNKGNIEFLLHLRSKNKEVGPNKWDTRFGGHIPSGTSIEEGILRELEEEIGLKIKISDLITGKIRKCGKLMNGEKEFVYTNYYEFNGDTNSLKFIDGEVQEVMWVKIEDIKNFLKNKSSFMGTLEGFIDTSKFLLEKIKKQD